MNKKQKIFLTILMFIIITPLLTFNFQSKVASKIDNRYLTEFDLSFDVSKSFSMLDSYIKDRIGFRNQLILGYSQFMNSVFHILSNPIYEYGKDNEVYYHFTPETSDQLYFESMASYVSRMEDYAHSLMKGFYFFTEPTKSFIVQDKLPDSLNYVFLRKNTMEESMKREVDTYYSTDSVLNQSMFNRRYDPGHWNQLGAFQASQYILQIIRNNYQNTGFISDKDYSFELELKKYLPESSINISEEVPLLNLKSRSIVILHDYVSQISVDPTFPYIFHTQNTELENAPRALVFGGSYFITDDNYSKFLAPAFSEMLFVHSYSNILNIDYYMNIFQPDLVIFETVEYASTEYFYSQYGMDHTIFPPNQSIFNNLENLEGSFVLSSTKDKSTPIQIELNSEGDISTIEFYIQSTKAKYAYVTLDGYDYTVRIENLGDQQIARFNVLNQHVSKGDIVVRLINQNENGQEVIKFDNLLGH